MNNNKMKLWLIIPVCAIVLLLGGTYAWYIWQTTQDEETIIATDTGYAQVFFDGGSDINGKLKPVSDKSKGMAKKITVSADKQFIEPISFNLYLDINKIDAGLKHESFKFELYKDGTKIKEGNFSEAFLTENLKVCEKNTGATHIILTSDTVTTTESVYILYTWIDGNMNNPLSMESQDFDFTLHADGQHAILGEKEEFNPLVHNGVIPEGGTYIRGAVIGNGDSFNGHDMTNVTTYSAGDDFPVEPLVGDIYTYGDFQYIYGYFNVPEGIEPSTIEQNATGVSYNNNDTYVMPIFEVTKMNLNYANKKWVPAENYYEDAEGWGVAYNTTSSANRISSYESLLMTINGKNVINLSGTFSDSHIDAELIITIPETVKYMDYAFYNCSINYQTKVIINSENITKSNDIFYTLHAKYNLNTMPVTIEVPIGSTTYNTLSNITLSNYHEVTLTTFVKE